MSETSYSIPYRNLPNIERATRETMEGYLKQEEAAWAPFLQTLTETGARVQFQYYQQTITGLNLAESLTRLREALRDPKTFATVNRDSHRRQSAPPPPSTSLEGKLIIGLFEAGRFNEALAAYVRFIVGEMGERARFQNNGETASLLQRGETLLAAAYAASALPFQKVTSAGLKSVKTEADKQLKILDAAVGEAKQVNADHRSELTGMRDRAAKQAVKLRGIFVRAEQRRGTRYRQWREAVDADFARRVEDAEARIEALDQHAQRQQEERAKTFEELKALFYTQLRLRAPVALWEQRATAHRQQAQKAQRYFMVSAVCAVIVGVFVPFCFGDYIAASFHVLRCLPDEPNSCIRQFSAKGPVTVSGILLATSLILWITRLQYRIFLSERHLSLDAEEKKAFAETFMALKEDATVDVANETIVLTSLFRPTQDGIIKDEGGGLDLSAAAILTKLMAK